MHNKSKTVQFQVVKTLCIVGGAIFGCLVASGLLASQPAENRPRTFSGPYKVEILDVNANGKKDLLFCFNRAHAVGVLLGDGRGNFFPPILSEFPTRNAEDNNFVFLGGHTFSTRDLNGNGLPDLLMGFGGTEIGLSSGRVEQLSKKELEQFWSGKIAVAKNIGNGRFKQVYEVMTTSHVKGVQFAALRTKNNIDLVAVTRGTGRSGDDVHGRLAIIRADDSKTYRFENNMIQLEAGEDLYYANVEDMNRDGYQDIIVNSLSGGYLGVWEHPKNPELFSQVKIKKYFLGKDINDVKIADMDGNGRKDIVAISLTGKVIILFQGKRSTSEMNFEAEKILEVDETAAFCVLKDLTGNGYPDIIVTHWQKNKIGIIYNYGGRQFSKVHFFEVGFGPYGVAVGDLNGNGHLDIVTANQASHTYSILFGKGNGEFYPAKTFKLELVLESGAAQWAVN